MRAMPSDPSKIVLYGEKHWDSPYVFTAFVTLLEKGVPFEVRLLDLEAGDQRAAEYREASLTARVPCIDHNGFVLSESSAIVEYLDEAFPPPNFPRLLPEGVRERARARQIMGWIRSDLMALREERSTATMFFEPSTKPLGPAARAAADKLLFLVDRVVPDGATTLFGKFCIADADLGFVLHRLILNGDPVPEKAERYAAAQWSRQSIRDFVERERPPR
jgi:glutathione S-transferase